MLVVNLIKVCNLAALFKSMAVAWAADVSFLNIYMFRAVSSNEALPTYVFHFSMKNNVNHSVSFLAVR